MSTVTITPNLRLQVVKHLASGKGLDVVATIVDLPRAAVVDIGAHHGYPDKEKLSWAADILAKKIEEERSQLPAGTAVRVDTDAGKVDLPRRTTPTTSNPGGPVALTRPLTEPDELRVLINTGKSHPSKRIQAATDRLLADADKLRTLIAEDTAKNSERRKAAEEKARLQAEVRKLEEQLASTRAKLRGKTASPTTSAAKATGQPTEASQVRAWAGEQGLECPKTGRIPRAVYDAWQETQDGAA